MTKLDELIAQSDEAHNRNASPPKGGFAKHHALKKMKRLHEGLWDVINRSPADEQDKNIARLCANDIAEVILRLWPES